MAPRRNARPLGQVLAAVVVGRAALAQDITKLSQVPLGCFSFGYKYSPALTNVTGMPFLVDSAVECQGRCQQTVGCGVFGYWVHNRECWLGGPYSKLQVAKTAGAIAGPAYCPQESAACSAIPGPEFPGETHQDSRNSWPQAQQPTNLQCWPRRDNGYPARCMHQPAMVLEDTASGWSGRCEGLVKITSLAAGESCQMRCMMSPLCAVWSLENVSSGNGNPTCWQGVLGTNCYNGAAVQPMRAQRIMHGSFRVLINTMGMQILNLTQAFDTTGFPNWQDGARKCRLTCLSYLLCQHWQYSEKWGCWIEDVTKKSVGYPLLNHFPDLVTDTKISDSVKAGEYIQHICKPGPAAPVPTDMPSLTGGWPGAAEGALLGAGAPKLPSSMDSSRTRPVLVDEGASSWPWWGSMLLGLCLFICVGALLAAGCLTFMDMRKKDGGRSRGVDLGNEPDRDSFHSDASGYSSYSGYSGYGQKGNLAPTRPSLGSTYQNLHPQQPATTPSRVSGSFWG